MHQPTNNELQRTRPTASRWSPPLNSAVRFLALLGLAAGVAACAVEPPKVAPSLTPTRLSSIRPGMHRDDVLKILGKPLDVPHPLRLHTYEVLHYATTGGTYFLNLRLGSLTGFGCSVLVEQSTGRVVAVRMFNPATDAPCECSQPTCPTEWPSRCFPQTPHPDTRP